MVEELKLHLVMMRLLEAIESVYLEGAYARGVSHVLFGKDSEPDDLFAKVAWQEGVQDAKIILRAAEENVVSLGPIHHYFRLLLDGDGAEPKA